MFRHPWISARRKISARFSSRNFSSADTNPVYYLRAGAFKTSRDVPTVRPSPKDFSRLQPRRAFMELASGVQRGSDLKAILKVMLPADILSSEFADAAAMAGLRARRAALAAGCPVVFVDELGAARLPPPDHP
jgi:hypothetical protein